MSYIYMELLCVDGEPGNEASKVLLVIKAHLLLGWYMLISTSVFVCTSNASVFI